MERRRIEDPTTGDILALVSIQIPGLDLYQFAAASNSAEQFLGKVHNASAGFPALVPKLTNPVVREVRLITRNGVVTSAAAQVRLTVTIEAGPGTNALEKAITGSAQADGVDLYQTAVTVSVAGLDFTSLDPATATLEQLVSDIEANVVAALTE